MFAFEQLSYASDFLETIAKRARTISIISNYPSWWRVFPNHKLSRFMVSFDFTVPVRGRWAAIGGPVQTNVDAQCGVVEIPGKWIVEGVGRV